MPVCHGCHGRIGQTQHQGSAIGRDLCTFPHSYYCRGGVIEDVSWRACPPDYVFDPNVDLAAGPGFESTLGATNFLPPSQVQGGPAYSTPLLQEVHQENPRQASQQLGAVPRLEGMDRVPSMVYIEGRNLSSEYPPVADTHFPETIQDKIDEHRSSNQAAAEAASHERQPEIDITNLRKDPGLQVEVANIIEDVIRQNIPSLSAADSALPPPGNNGAGIGQARPAYAAGVPAHPQGHQPPSPPGATPQQGVHQHPHQTSQQQNSSVPDQGVHQHPSVHSVTQQIGNLNVQQPHQQVVAGPPHGTQQLSPQSTNQQQYHRYQNQQQPGLQMAVGQQQGMGHPSPLSAGQQQQPVHQNVLQFGQQPVPHGAAQHQQVVHQVGQPSVPQPQFRPQLSSAVRYQHAGQGQSVPQLQVQPTQVLGAASFAQYLQQPSPAGNVQQQHFVQHPIQQAVGGPHQHHLAQQPLQPEIQSGLIGHSQHPQAMHQLSPQLSAQQQQAAQQQGYSTRQQAPLQVVQQPQPYGHQQGQTGAAPAQSYSNTFQQQPNQSQVRQQPFQGHTAQSQQSSLAPEYCYEWLTDAAGQKILVRTPGTQHGLHAAAAAAVPTQSHVQQTPHPPMVTYRVEYRCSPTTGRQWQVQVPVASQPPPVPRYRSEWRIHPHTGVSYQIQVPVQSTAASSTSAQQPAPPEPGRGFDHNSCHQSHPGPSPDVSTQSQQSFLNQSHQQLNNSTLSRQDRVAGIVSLLEGGGGTTKKLPKVLEYAKTCPTKWSKQATSSNINLPLYAWGAVTEIEASLSGRSEALNDATMLGKIRHLKNTLEVCCLNSTATDFSSYSWTLARDYANKVDNEVEQKLATWQDMPAGVRTATLVSAQMENPRPLPKLPPAHAQVKSAVSEKKELCTTYNSCSTEGKCDYEVAHPDKRCFRKHECSYCMKSKKQSWRHQAVMCKVKASAEAGGH